MQRQLILAIDFDGTLVERAFPAIGDPVEGAFEWLLKFQQEGAIVILWTCRTGELLTAAVEFCRARGVMFDAINANAAGCSPSAKVEADVYVDDRAIGIPLLHRPRGRHVVDWSEVGPMLHELVLRAKYPNRWRVKGQVVPGEMADQAADF